MAAMCTCCSTVRSISGSAAVASRQPICHNCLARPNGQRNDQSQRMTRSRWSLASSLNLNVCRCGSLGRLVRASQLELSLHDDTYAFAHGTGTLMIHLAQADPNDPPGHGALYLHCEGSDEPPGTGERRTSMSMVPATRTTGNGKDLSPTRWKRDSLRQPHSLSRCRA